ncbi:1588_t:CDS:2 [Funneliformis caledonium]|uniref:1588_t:CDS:1 n=1 Tax=Funneliformis caledonium TaxID=1117310 RepID=A0A9N9IB81_9GLOM|nr:1588_t:CDS:2 [Funneliformis caledonium]
MITLPTIILTSPTESPPVTSEHISDMCEEMKVMFIRSQNPGCRLEYLAQHCLRFNNDLNFYAEEYVKINNISSTNEIPTVIKEDELFNNITIINTLKILLKKAFMLHLTLEVSHLTNYNMDNHHTLQQVKELDHLTSDLTIPNLTQKNATNQINISASALSRRRIRRSHR